jgi:hypothetical protein
MAARKQRGVRMWALRDGDGAILRVEHFPSTVRSGWCAAWSNPAWQKWRHWYRKGLRVVPVLVTPAPKPRRKK